MIKRKYITPTVEEIRLDNEISLQLASNAPENPREVVGMTDSEEESYSYENW